MARHFVLAALLIPFILALNVIPAYIPRYRGIFSTVNRQNSIV
jgi:hypothetical protein